MKLGYLLLALTLAGCEWFERELEWKQEARLQDGRILVVDRVSRVTGKRFPEGGNYDIYQALSFTHPDTGERLSWAPPEGSGPVMVDVDGPNAYFIVEAISVGDYNRLGCPNPPYFAYRYSDKQWLQVALADLPERFVERNLHRRSMDDRKSIADGTVTATEYAAFLREFPRGLRYETVSRRKVNPIAKGCDDDVLVRQGRQSEIDYRR